MCLAAKPINSAAPDSKGCDRALRQGSRAMNTANPQNTKVLTALFAAALLVPFIGLDGWRFLTRPSEADDQLALIVQQYGYHAVTPPSRLFGPGTITTVETLQNGTLQLHPTCIMDEGALAAMWH